MRVPGFVDLQVNGYRGVSFSSMELTEDDFACACRALFASGTAAFLPTVITNPIEVYRHVLPLMARVASREEFARRLPGFHIEGPFISPEPGAVGAHDKRYVRAPDVELFDELMALSEGRVKLLTIAAELPGADELARHAAGRGVVVSLGHQLAVPDDLDRLARAGASAITHLGNGIPNVLPRHPNPIWSAMADDRLSATIITDGHHLPREFIKVAVRAKGVARTIVVSDAAPIAGMPPGKYHSLGFDVVLEEDGKLHDPAKGCLAGSSATMLDCMNHLASAADVSLEDMMRIGRTGPLELIGLSDDDAHREPMLEYDERKCVFALAD